MSTRDSFGPVKPKLNAKSRKGNFVFFAWKFPPTQSKLFTNPCNEKNMKFLGDYEKVSKIVSSGFFCCKETNKFTFTSSFRLEIPSLLITPVRCLLLASPKIWEPVKAVERQENCALTSSTSKQESSL